MHKVLLLLILPALFFQCHERIDSQDILQDIEKEFVPDSRTGIFSIKMKQNSSKIILKGETDNKGAHIALLQKLKNSNYKIEDRIIILPQKMAQPWGLISVSVANLRKAPSQDAEMITQALMGTPIKVLKEDDNWVLAQTPDKYLAWCEKDVIHLCTDEELNKWKKSKRVIVNEWFTFLKDSLTNEIVCDLVAGSILEFSSETQDTAILITPDGRKGKLAKTYFQNFNSWKNKDIPTLQTLVKTAKGFMGTPYLWGGASAKAVDCSGFVKTVYFLNGFIISRDASQQALYGTEISITKDYKFLPGDLVFFGRRLKNDATPKITHVGMYVGNTEFIHSSGMVKLNSFDSTRSNYSRYRTISLLGVRRIIGALNSEGIVFVKNHPWY